MSETAKCCWKCGRRGTRGFIDNGDDKNTTRWECANDRACKRRRHGDEWSSR